jgi:rhodanese-related sulfurtransferase
MGQLVKGISHESLYKLLQGTGRTCLIDVRDYDFGHGGMIRGAIHVPSVSFSEERARSIIEACAMKKMESLVCYCSLGRARSVQCAKLLGDSYDLLRGDWGMDISWLEGGFRKFKSWYNDTSLVVSFPLWN